MFDREAFISLSFSSFHEQVTLLQELAIVPGISLATVNNLARDLPSYVARARGDPVSAHGQDDGDDNALQRWWMKHGPHVGSWGAAYCACLLMVPSSASAERAFSLLKATFSSDMLSSHEDYREVAVMLQFNGAKIKRGR